MYGSFHFITNLTRLYEDEAPTVKAHVVGPICETGDVLGVIMCVLCVCVCVCVVWMRY